jgi:ATP-binding cassette subfamily B protein
MSQKTDSKQKQGIPRLLEIAGTKRRWLIGSMLPAVCAAAQFTSFVSVYNLLTEFAAHAADPSQVNSKRNRAVQPGTDER